MIDKGNLVFAEELLKTSKSHLTSSKTLYNEKQYADTIMLLQQSVENAIKAYFVIMGFEPENLKKFQHTPIDEDVLTSIHMLFFGLLQKFFRYQSN